MKKNFWLTAGIYMGLSLFLIFADQQKWMGAVKRIAEGGTSKFRLETRNLKPVLSERENLLKLLEIRQNKCEVEKMILQKENEQLRKLLGAALPKEWQFLPANILSVSGAEMVIDKGRTDAVEEGMAAVSEEGVLAGKVKVVSERQSKIELPMSINVKTKVEIMCRTEECSASRRMRVSKGLLIGDGKEIWAEKVLIKEEIEAGDLTATAGDLSFPKGILIGKVIKVEKDAAEVYQRLKIEPLAEYGKMKMVFLIKLW